MPVRSDRSFVRVDCDIALRPCAISAVVWNHSDIVTHSGMGGGMTVLMMLSGFMFARFSLRDSSPERVRRSLISLGWHIFLPSLLIVVLYACLFRRFDWQELLFVSNWWTINRVAHFPTWYPQVILQMFFILYLLFLTPAGHLASARPVAFSLGVFLIGVAIRFAFPIWIWDTTYLHNNLPYLYLWNFALGWVVYFLTEVERRTLPGLALAWGCILLGAEVGWGWTTHDFYWLVIAGAIFVFFPKITLPRPVGITMGVVSQATFAIFLLHRTVLLVMTHFFPETDYEPSLRWCLAMSICISAWIIFTSVVRAYRVLDIERPPLPA